MVLREGNRNESLKLKGDMFYVVTGIWFLLVPGRAKLL